MTKLIEKAEFIKGIIGTDSLLNDQRPQIVFVGRSNVGKSSLINALTGQKSLAISSATPGRTQQINYFLINERFYFADFPGYGYAKTDWKKQEKIRKLILWFFERSQVRPRLVVLVTDAKAGLKEFDREMLELLVSKNLACVVVANKVDRFGQKELAAIRKNYLAEMGKIPLILFSSKTGVGKNELINRLATTL